MNSFKFIPNCKNDNLNEIKSKYEDAMKNSIPVLGEVYKIDKEGNLFVNLSQAMGMVSKDDIFLDDITLENFNKELNDLLINRYSYFIVKDVTLKNFEVHLKLNRKQAIVNVRKDIIEKVKEGDYITGRVKSIQPYAAFIDIGGDITGILHQNNININTSMNFIKKGDHVKVKVLSFDTKNLDIEFAITDLKDPWENLNIQVGDRIHAIVRNYLKRGNFVSGVFLELVPGVDGLLSLDGLDNIKFNKLSLSFVIGQKIPVRVIKIDKHRKRLKLGLIT